MIPVDGANDSFNNILCGVLLLLGGKDLIF